MITDLNKIIAEWSYRTRDGKPDVNNNAKLILLEGVLTEFGWSREAKAELLNNLINEVKPTPFIGMSKAGKKRYFQDKDSLQRAIKRGSVTPVDKKDDDDKKDSDGKLGGSDFDRDGSEEPKDGDDEVGTKEVKSKNALKVKQQLDNLDGPDVVASNGKTRRENAEEVMILVDRYDNAETDDEKRDALKAMADSKLFSKSTYVL